MEERRVWERERVGLDEREGGGWEGENKAGRREGKEYGGKGDVRKEKSKRER